MVDGISPKIELDWIAKRSEKLQKALLEMELDNKKIAESMVQAKKELDELRAKEIRLLAAEEEKQKGIEDATESKSESESKSE